MFFCNNVSLHLSPLYFYEGHPLFLENQQIKTPIELSLSLGLFAPEKKSLSLHSHARTHGPTHKRAICNQKPSSAPAHCTTGHHHWNTKSPITTRNCHSHSALNCLKWSQLSNKLLSKQLATFRNKILTEPQSTSPLATYESHKLNSTTDDKLWQQLSHPPARPLLRNWNHNTSFTAKTASAFLVTQPK